MKYININEKAALGKSGKVCVIQLSSPFEVPGNQSEKSYESGRISFIITEEEHCGSLREEKLFLLPEF